MAWYSTDINFCRALCGIEISDLIMYTVIGTSVVNGNWQLTNTQVKTHKTIPIVAGSMIHMQIQDATSGPSARLPPRISFPNCLVDRHTPAT
jgi:hypothetical protein